MTDQQPDPDITNLPIFGATSDLVTKPGTWQPGSPRDLLTQITNRSATPPQLDAEPAEDREQVDWAEPDGDPAGIDWAQVRSFRARAAELLSVELHGQDIVSGDRRRELGRRIIKDLLDEHVQKAYAAGRGRQSFSPDYQLQLSRAIFDSLFGLGRLQPLVDDDEIENIEVYGADKVVLIYADGAITPGPAVADSEEELNETLAFLASRGGDSERTFAQSSPSLHLNLHGGHRLAASGWTTHQTHITIRRHRMVDIDLNHLRQNNTISAEVARFLTAAVRAKRSVVVSGSQGAGKTTLVRALANTIDPWEKLGTIETEYELHLQDLPERHQRIIAWEARPGSGERGPDGRAIGEITLDELVFDALRMNLDRLIVGEVRGKEVLPMFKAMQSGAGSLSTTHAHSARAAIERLVTCAMEAGPHVTENFAYRQIAEHIDLIVHIRLRDERHGDGSGRRQRYVSEIIALGPGEHGMPAITDVFTPGPDGHAVRGTLPEWVNDLDAFGYNPIAGGDGL